MSSFTDRIAEAMRTRGLGLRELCREAGLDPSFFSKVLSGKRSPPSEEDALRRLAKILELDAAELIVAAGRVPAEWGALSRDRSLFDRVNALASGSRAPAVARSAVAKVEKAAPEPRRFVVAKPPLSEELL